jgi:hypothetical protein
MAGDHLGGLGRTVTVQIGAAESGSANFHDGFARSGMGVWKLADFSFSITFKHDTTHRLSPYFIPIPHRLEEIDTPAP